MTISELLLPEYEQEMKSTRKLLECVPDEKLTYKPHEKSMSVAELASHITMMPFWAAETINRDTLDLGPGQKPFLAASKTELLKAFDTNVELGRAAIAVASDEHLAKTWTLTAGGKTLLAMPRVNVLRSVVMNHLIHHRAQLGVALRLLDIAIPGMYGPSADDRVAAASA
ncbi:MAG TPA: DinB family protein [Bryobacteraceae bacterium]|nr:DinB family protein [Bryobacteraceae bacterium]